VSKKSKMGKHLLDLLEKEPVERDFPGGPVVKNSPSNAGGVVQSLVRELRSHMLWGN